MNPRIALVCFGFITTDLLWSIEATLAGDWRLGPGYGSRAVEPCDPFTDDLDGATPGQTCLRFGGRVRVDLGAQAPSESGFGAAPAAVRVDEVGDGSSNRLDLPSSLDSGMTRSHVRVPTPSTTGTFDPYGGR